MNDKKEYRLTLEIINGIHSPSQFYDKLNKLFATSDDQAFRKLLFSAMESLKEAHRALVIKKQTSHKTSINFGIEPFSSLVSYCQQQLKNVKPTWQILAERHGWAPKGKA